MAPTQPSDRDDHSPPQVLPLEYASPPPPRTMPRHRKLLSAALLLAATAVAVLGCFVHGESARANVWTVAAALLLWGLVVGLQHVKL